MSGKKNSVPMVNPPPMEAPEPIAREWRTSVDKSTGRFFVRDPITDEITPVEREEAEKLLLHQGYQPVDEDSAKEYHKAELYKQYGEENPLEAVTTGLTRGLTGGLEDLAMAPDDAKLRQAVVDEHPWLAGLSEVGSTLGTLALSGGASGLARLTPVGALAHGGELITKGVGKVVPLTSVARGVGTAAEGAVYSGIQAARDAHMYEEPLTVQQIGSQMLGGAIFSGVLGGGFGLLEKRGGSMGSRLAKGQEERIAAALKPGLDDHELVAILKAEGIDVTPSALKVFQAGLYNDKDITPELLALADDRGPVGEALRKRLANGGQDRAAAEARLADALQAQHERDDVLREHYGGRLKKQHFKNLIDDSDASSMEQVFKADSPDAINTMAEHVAKVDAGTRADLARALGVSEKGLADKVRVGLATRDGAVQKGVADVLKGHPLPRDFEKGAFTVAERRADEAIAEGYRAAGVDLHTVAPVGATRPVVANDLSAAGVELTPDARTVIADTPQWRKEAAGGAPNSEIFEWKTLQDKLGYEAKNEKQIARDAAEPDRNAARAEMRRQAGLGDAYHELGALDERYPALGLQAREAVQKHGLTQQGWQELAKNYPALETGEAMRLLARAKQEIEATGATFGKMGGVIPGDPMPSVAPEAPRGTRVPMWQREGARVLKDARERFEWLTAMPKGYVADKKYGDVAKMLDVISGAEQHMAMGDKLEAFAQLDYVKKRLGQAARPGEVLPVGAWPAQKAREAYENLRVVLEDEGLWGRAASAQRGFNERLHKRLARLEGVEGRYMKDAGVPHPTDPWRSAKRVDLGGIRRLVDELSGNEGSHALKALADHIDEGSELNGLMKQYFELEPGALKAVNAAEGAAVEARQALKEALDAAKREKQMAKLQGQHGPSYGARGLLWAVLGGAPGAVAAHAADQVMNPGRAIYWRGVLERFANNTESKVAGGIAKALAKGPKSLFEAMSKPAGRAARAVPQAKRIFDDVMSEDYLSRVKTYNATIKELSGVAAGNGLTEALTGRLGDAMMVAPTLLPKLKDQAMKTAQALLMHAPAQPSNDFWGDEVAPVSETQMQDFFRKYEIATDPTTLVDLLQTGELMPGDMDIAKQVAPDLVAWIQQKVVETMAGSKAPYETRIQVSLLIDKPLDPTMDPEYITAQQQLHTDRFAQEAPRRSPSTFEPTGLQDQYRTEMDRIESGVVPQ